MEPEELSALVATLTGHLQAATPDQEKQVEQAQQAVVQAITTQQTDLIRNRTFQIENSDLFRPETIDRSRLQRIDKLIERARARPSEESVRVFVRDVPVRTTQLAGSVPDWAAGAQPTRTIGPLLSPDGRLLWFDVFRVEKLVALYLQGQVAPVLLFKTTFRRGPILQPNPPLEARRQYTVVAGSVWVRADVLSKTAPADRYCGLRAKEGDISLSELPQLQNGKLVVNGAVTFTVALTLDPQTDPHAGVTDAQGTDARTATFKLPEKFAFTFTASAHSIRDLSDAAWRVYGQPVEFRWVPNREPVYEASLSRVLIPMKTDAGDVKIVRCQSPFNVVSDDAPIERGAWALSAAVLDVNNPLEAAGVGGLIVRCGPGLRSEWTGLDGADARLLRPWLFGEPGRIALIDLAANLEGATQSLLLWQDDLNPHGTTADLTMQNKVAYLYNSSSEGIETLITRTNAHLKTDRPMQVSGEPVVVQTKGSTLILAEGAHNQVLFLFDENMLEDNRGSKQASQKTIAFALENALFTTSEVTGCLFIAFCSDDWTKAVQGNLFLGFNVFSYLPTLPDPYAANVNLLRRQFVRPERGGRVPIFQLIGQIQHRPLMFVNPPQPGDPIDAITVSFHFGDDLKPEPVAPTRNPNQVKARKASRLATDFMVPEQITQLRKDQLQAGEIVEGWYPEKRMNAGNLPGREGGRIPNYEQDWNEHVANLETDAFALLDVSTNAHLLGVSFGTFGMERMGIMRTATVAAGNEANTQQLNRLPFIVHDMSVYTTGMFSRLFMLPQVAWEPVINLPPPPPEFPMDPPLLHNFYPDDGGPTRVFTFSSERVQLAPLPVKEFMLERTGKDPLAISFTLPFAMKALAFIRPNSPRETIKSTLADNEPHFKRGQTDLVGGVQIKASAGNFGKKARTEEPIYPADSPMFEGLTLQLNNIRNLAGQVTGASTLGDSVTRVFNTEFFDGAVQDPNNMRGVPVSRIDFSGYGASLFSNWLSPQAAFAGVSQARFDVLRGRTAHEVIQIRSKCYPWGPDFVRTITLFRVSSGYVYRHDSGWQAENDGLFDFRFTFIPFGPPPPPPLPRTKTKEPYTIHPGMVRGLFNIRNIVEDKDVAPFETQNVIPPGESYINVNGEEGPNTTGQAIIEQVLCRPVWFDADVELEGVTQGYVGQQRQGQTRRRVPCRRILGYVQLAPIGKPLTPEQFRDLLNLQGGSIGGSVDCTINVNNSDQQMRINRFDVNAAEDDKGNPLFVGAARGSVFLPKDGSWSLVQHSVDTGEVTPLPETTAVPLIRIGNWIPEKVVADVDVAKQLLRIANPADLLRTVNDNTLNFGFLQSTATQKALFLTPAYRQGVTKLLSKTPPLVADAYRLMTGNGIFPNIGNAITNFGKVIPLETGRDSANNVVNAFTSSGLLDGGKPVLELLEIQAEKQVEAVIRQGMALAAKGANGLLDKALQFDVPSFNIPLIDMDGLAVYIEYQTTSKVQNAGNPVSGKLNYSLDSFAGAVADTWKSRLNNLAMVVDLGPIKRLMTIKGNFDARPGKESSYEGSVGDVTGLPMPEIEFSPKLKPVIDLLEILASLSTGDYGDVMKKGLKIAMSNAGEVWEYKFEAGKDIPLVRFPPTKALYDNPTTPLKLEASMGLGVYFNAALKVTTDSAQILPSAGAFLTFHGGLSVMCVSLAVGTVYAVGEVDLRIACDTAKGPSLAMQFGFGAQVVVGLPVVGNVSVLYMVGIEIYVETGEVAVTAFMLFRGHAELLGGLVGVTITIEASGTITRTDNGTADPADDRTDCSAQVTFAIDISIFLIIDISFSTSWGESRQIA